jgi:ABC-type multidrug transport system fused ATPase/permease subunit
VFDSEIPDLPLTTQALNDGALAIEATGLVFGFEGQPALKGLTGRTQVLSGVDLQIHPGETVAIVGSTGAGKSTLCSVLCGLLPPEAGEVRLGGVPVAELDSLERTDAVALVFQESFLFADSVRANIDLTGVESDEAVREAAAIARADAFIDELPEGYDTVVGERGVTLSGGQRQRVALARALIRRPRLLVLDDATSAVDAEVEQQILANLRASVDATVVVVAQRVSTIELADRVLYFHAGRIAAAGTHTELLAHPGYESLVRAYEQAV